ncbi:hypothetical protein HWV62_20294 [Athelia sp. TMB]|nr:hypothetical protein HWV62_20294 [Athelia sp. TMB]
MKSSQILKNFPKKTPHEVFTLARLTAFNHSLESSQVFQGGKGINNGRPFDSGDNTRWNTYYIPEITSVIEKYLKLQSNPIALESFVTAQKAMASQMMQVRHFSEMSLLLADKILLQDAITLSNWVSSSRNDKAQDDAERRKIRRARHVRIEEKLEELGWDRALFPTHWNWEWHQLVEQPRELTPRIWKVIHPKLEVFLNKVIADKALKELEARRALRRKELAPLWSVYVQNNALDHQSPIIPNYRDVCDFSPVQKVLFADEGHTPLTEERWNSIVECLPEQIEAFRKQVQYTLLNRLESTRAHRPHLGQESELDGPVPSGMLDTTPLNHASGLFICESWTGCGKVLGGVAAIATHQDFDGMRWSTICATLRGVPEAKSAVTTVLKAVGLPEDTCLETVQDLGDTFLCLCGNPEHRDPMSFTSLMGHIFAENKYYENVIQMKSRLLTGYGFVVRIWQSTFDFDKAGIDFHNDHCLTDAEPFVALLPNSPPLRVAPEDGSADVLVNDVGPTVGNWSMRRSCKYCYAIGQHNNFKIGTREELDYHMRAKHHRNKFEDDDVLPMIDLEQWKASLRKGASTA